MDNADRFIELVKNASNILVTSHISPDPDAVSSVLLLGRTLKRNFPDKGVKMCLEEQIPQDLSFLAGFDEIEFGSLTKSTEGFDPDLFISVDAAGMQRLSRNDFGELSSLVYDQLKSKVVIIDHHLKNDEVKADLYIKSDAPATAQALYELMFDRLELEKPNGYAEMALLGIVRDTNRFLYDNPQYKETFRIVGELLDAGASVEHLEYKLNRYSKDELEVLSNLASNVTIADGYNYSYISDDFAKKWQNSDRPVEALKAATDIFSGQFLRSIEGNYWGFLVYPQFEADDKSYSASFRSVSGKMDVSAIAKRLGGGGHKEAAGARGIKASSVEKAINIIKNTLTG